MKNRTNRRQWIRSAAGGSLGVGAVALAGCSSDSKPVAKRKPLRVPGTVPLQVICHGMMAFKLPKKGDSPYYLEIHIPYVKDDMDTKYDHVYKAGDKPTPGNYMTSDLKQGYSYWLDLDHFNPIHPNALPEGIYTTPNVLLSPDSGCDCTLPKDNLKRFCKIVMPMPDEYEGYVAGYSSGPLFNSGKTTTNCKNPLPGYKYPFPLKDLTSIPLVHVFRYWSVNSATLVQTDNPPAKPSDPVQWRGGSKLYIFAEPPNAMPSGSMSNSHLTQLDNLYVQPADLAFAEPMKLGADSPVGDGGLILDDDLQSLAAYSSRGGNPADCISSWGS